MASVTLAQSAKLSQDTLVVGVIENVVTVNRMFELLPFEGIEGNALAYNRELALGDVQVGGVDTAITAKTAATFTQVASSLTTIVGDAEINGLLQATRSNLGNDQTAVQIASKAKACGRSFQNMMINGTGGANQFNGLINLCGVSQEVTTTGNGQALSFALLDELIDAVSDKDGEVDYIAMPQRTIRSLNALLRALGGAAINDVLELPSGRTVPQYRGIPVLRNDWIPINQTQAAGTALTTVFAGTFDDGSQTHGLAGLTAKNEAGIVVEEVGLAEAADNRIWRVKWYCGLALFNELGLAMLTGITN